MTEQEIEQPPVGRIGDLATGLFRIRPLIVGMLFGVQPDFGAAPAGAAPRTEPFAGTIGMVTVEQNGPVRAVVLQSDAVDAALKSGSIAAYRLVLGLARVLSQRLAQMDQKMFEMCSEESHKATLTQYADAKQSLKTW